MKPTKEKAQKGALDQYFDEVYDRTYPDVLKYVLVKTSRMEAVEDILQDIYRNFYARIAKKGYEDIQQPIAFLMTIAKKELSRHYTRQRQRQDNDAQLDLSVLADPAPPPDDLLDNREALAAVWKVVQTCPPLTCQAFALFYGCDLSMEEISTKLGLSVQAVKGRLFRARAAVRTHLQEVTNREK